MALPYLPLPHFPTPNARRGFADRENELSTLYRLTVEACNAERRGVPNVKVQQFVSGYQGVGKSSLLLELLSMIRGQPARYNPNGEPLLAKLPVPNDQQRWLLLYLSGKRTSGTAGLGESLSSLLAGAEGDLESEINQATMLNWFERTLLLRDDKKLYDLVEQERLKLVEALQFVQFYYGKHIDFTTTFKRSDETNEQYEARIKASIAASLGVDDKVTSSAGLGVAAKIVSTQVQQLSQQGSIENRFSIDVGMAVRAMNIFFAATRKARLPTVLVLDDIDDISSWYNPTIDSRQKFLSLIFKDLLSLNPTVLLLGLRSEYTTGEVSRRVNGLNLPGLDRKSLADAAEAWGRAFTPEDQTEQETSASMKEVRAFYERFISAVAPDRATHFTPLSVLIPLARLVNQNNPDADLPSSLLEVFNMQYGLDIVDMMRAIASKMSESDMVSSMRGELVEAQPYELSDAVYTTLEREGLIRKAQAGTTGHTKFFIDPHIAFLKHLSLSTAPRG